MYWLQKYIKLLAGRGPIMKKILSGVLAITLCASVFADSSNSIDGTISVAGRGDMPSGLFGKAAGYLPGDTVSITNPTTGITLQILNLGTLDASDGVALLLSQESAEKLGVVEKSDTQVKLAPRSGYFDQSVSGAAVLSRIGNEDSPKTEKVEEEIQVAEVSDVVETPVMENSTDVHVENIAAEEIAETPVETESSEVADNSFLETKNAVEQASPAEVHPEEIMESAVAEEITSEDPLFDNEAASVTHVSAEDILVPEEPAAEIADSPVESEEVAEAPVEEAFEADELSPVEMELAADESVPEVAAVEPEAEIEEEASPVEEVAEAPVEEAFEADELSPVEMELAADEPVPEVAAVEPEAEIEEEASPVEEVAEAPVEEAFEADELSPVEKELAVDEPVPEVAAEENSVDEEVAEIPAESEVVAEAFEADELEPVANEIDTKESEPEVAAVETEVEDYSPIVLVPAEPVPAENTLEAVVEEEVKPVMTEVNLKSFTDYIVDSENDLRKNSYYVQFATLGDEKNIESTINKYNKYPLILVPNGKGAYKIMVGPLTVDEFGAVQAKFKSFGYKDAFVKSK